MVLLLIKNMLDAQESHPVVTDTGFRYAQIRGIIRLLTQSRHPVINNFMPDIEKFGRVLNYVTWTLLSSFKSVTDIDFKYYTRIL